MNSLHNIVDILSVAVTALAYLPRPTVRVMDAAEQEKDKAIKGVVEQLRVAQEMIQTVVAQQQDQQQEVMERIEELRDLTHMCWGLEPHSVARNLSTMPLRELPLRRRWVNLLLEDGIYTVGELVAKIRAGDRYWIISGFGRSARDEVERVLRFYGLLD